MKIYQLVEELKKYDQNLDVIVDGYEGGTNPLEISNIGLKYVDTKDGQEWCGDYGDPEDSPDRMESPLLAVILGRMGWG